jgi:hypothetical protein
MKNAAHKWFWLADMKKHGNRYDSECEQEVLPGIVSIDNGRRRMNEPGVLSMCGIAGSYYKSKNCGKIGTVIYCSNNCTVASCTHESCGKCDAMYKLKDGVKGAVIMTRVGKFNMHSESSHRLCNIQLEKKKSRKNEGLWRLEKLYNQEMAGIFATDLEQKGLIACERCSLFWPKKVLTCELCNDLVIQTFNLQSRAGRKAGNYSLSKVRVEQDNRRSVLFDLMADVLTGTEEEDVALTIKFQESDEEEDTDTLNDSSLSPWEREQGWHELYRESSKGAAAVKKKSKVKQAEEANQLVWMELVECGNGDDEYHDDQRVWLIVVLPRQLDLPTFSVHWWHNNFHLDHEVRAIWNMVKEFVMIEKNRKGQLTIQGRLDTRLHMMARHGTSEHLVKYLGGQDSASVRKGVVRLSNGINHMYDATRPF